MKLASAEWVRSSALALVLAGGVALGAGAARRS